MDGLENVAKSLEFYEHFSFECMFLYLAMGESFNIMLEIGCPKGIRVFCPSGRFGNFTKSWNFAKSSIVVL